MSVSHTRSHCQRFTQTLDFATPIDCIRGEYEWTVEKENVYLDELRRNLADMIRRYKISGNGDNQVIHDDSDTKPLHFK